MSRVAIMQPYFCPYIGYFQLIQSVDQFIVYDNIKYTKKGWINRNRMLLNGADVMFSLPLKKDSDSLDVVQREIAADFSPAKLLNQLRGAYARAPQFVPTFPLLERIILNEERNLFRYIHQSIVEVCRHLGIGTEIRVSSEVDADRTLKGAERVLAICHAVGASTYVNAIGGTELYSKDDFRARGVELRFLRSKALEYAQFGAPFVPWLSIIDVLMFNPLDAVRDQVANGYELV